MGGPSKPRSGTYRREPGRSPLADYRDEHERLRDWLGKLETDDPADLSVALLGFRSALLLHFAGEEGRGGLFALIGEQRGQDRVVAQLRGEHHDMLMRIQRLQRQVSADGYDLDPISARLRDELVALVMRHEAYESALLQELLLTDLGDGF